MMSVCLKFYWTECFSGSMHTGYAFLSISCGFRTSPRNFKILDTRTTMFLGDNLFYKTLGPSFPQVVYLLNLSNVKIRVGNPNPESAIRPIFGPRIRIRNLQTKLRIRIVYFYEFCST